jgi:hypothetical protein
VTSRAPAIGWLLRLAAAGLLAPTLAACADRGAPNATSTALGAHLSRVSRQQVEQDVAALYRRHPDIGSFAIQDVQYTPKTRDDVLSACTAGGAAPASETVESGRLVACAPLIFFFYSYGRKASVPEAIDLADKLYSYAVTNITGPLDAQKALGGLLHGWGIPVAQGKVASRTGTLEVSIVAAAKKAILAQRSVHIVVTQYRGKSKAAAERIVADTGTSTGIETLTAGHASATIMVRAASAYFSGDPAGLTTLIGVSSSAAKKIGSRWVEIKAGTSEYKNLAAENLISSLPASILPAAGSSGALSTGTAAGQQVYLLTWQATPSGSGTTISERLVLAATAAPLPISETGSAAGDTQTVQFTRWGERLAVAAPSPVIPFSSLTSS